VTALRILGPGFEPAVVDAIDILRCRVAAAEVAKYNQWTLNEIRDRQAKLAKLAMKTWPIDL
jgi:hypothetical protein